MRMPKRKIQQWIDALRSGDFEQGTGQLQRAENEFCCLGVACKIFNPERHGGSNQWLKGTAPILLLHDPKWLVEVNDVFGELTGETLITLNDSGLVNERGARIRFDFNDIADLLQAVFIEEVLK